MLNPLLSIDRVSSKRTLFRLYELLRIAPDEDKDELVELINEHEEFLERTKPVSKNVFGICLGLSYW